MDDQSQLAPPAPEPDPAGGSVPSTPAPLAAPAAPSWWSRWHRLVIAAAGTAVVLGVAATALLVVLKPAPSIERMVPASADLYGFVNLDPSVAQKMELVHTIHRFPDTSTDQKVSDLLDKWLKDSGLSYSRDIQPWLGSGIGFAAKLPGGGTDARDMPSAVLAVSRDDQKAQAFLAKVRTGKFTINNRQKPIFRNANQPVNPGPDYTWQDKSYDGVAIAVGTPRTQSGLPPVAYAIVDHVVVAANDEALLREVIDAGHGRAPRLVDSAQYKATIAGLPSDRLGVFYANGKSIVGRLKDQLTAPLSSGLGSLRGINDLNAFQGAAVVVSARSDGIAADVAVRVDSSKLSASTRAALSNAGHADRVIGWIPASTDAFFAFGNLKQTIQSFLDQMGTQPSVQQSTDEAGLTGPHGVLPHLTGDFAFEVEIDHAFTPAGAVLIGTDSPAALRTFFAGLLTLATQGSFVQPTTLTSTYRGVGISTVSDPSWGADNLYAPSYAVLDGIGVMASNPAELKAIIDAHKDHAGVDHDATYVEAGRASLSNAGSVFYVAIGRLVDTVQSAPANSPIGGLHIEAANGNLAALKTFIVTSSSSAQGVFERIIVFIR